MSEKSSSRAKPAKRIVVPARLGGKTLRKQIAERVAEEAIGHIDTMYPKMWENVPRSARVSLRGSIINTVVSELERLLCL